jgi:tetratricopeptide (TPR) repeat protein
MKKLIFLLFIGALIGAGVYAYRNGRLSLDFKKPADTEEIARFRKALKIDPDNPDIHNSLGIAYYKTGRLQDALKSFQKVVAIDPQFSEGYYNIGSVYGNLGRYEEAIAEYNRAIALKADQADALNNIGLALMQSGNDAAALNSFREALKLNPQLTAARNNIALVHLKNGKLDDAVAELEETIKIFPAHPETHYNLAVAFNKKGKIEHAVNEYKKTLDLKPDFALASYGLGKIYYEIEKNKDKALKYFRDYLVTFPNDRDVRDIVGRIKSSMAAPNTAQPPAAAAHHAASARTPVPAVPAQPRPQPREHVVVENTDPDLTLREFDTDNDGQIDLWLFYNQSNKPVKKKIDTDKDGLPDKEEHL